MRRALIIAALAGSIVGFGAGTAVSSTRAIAETMTLFRTEDGLIECLNYDKGELIIEQFDKAYALAKCRGENQDKDGDGILNRDEKAAKHRTG